MAPSYLKDILPENIAVINSKNFRNSENITVPPTKLRHSCESFTNGLSDLSTGIRVLCCYPSPQPFKARYHGPYIIDKKVHESDIIVQTPDC